MADSIHHLPPWRIESVLSASEVGQVTDWGLLAYGVPDAWRHTRGEGVRVAVLDTGIQQDHPDLVGQWDVEPVDFTGSPWGPEDRVGHGTHVAGVIAAVDGLIGVVGVANRVKLLPCKVLGDDGSGFGSWVAKGIHWALEHGAHVISMSLGSPAPDRQMRDAIEVARSAGAFVVCAAGNSGPNNPFDIDYPARWPGTVAVASVRRDGRLSDFSSRGASVDIAAPGEQVLSTFSGGGYAKLSGTSMATPFVAGIVALLVARHRELGGESRTPLNTREQLLEHLKRHAVDVGPPGRDEGSGWGVVKVGELIGGLEPSGPNLPEPGEYNLGGVLVHVPAKAGDQFSVDYPG